jgi:hypothetical protein
MLQELLTLARGFAAATAEKPMCSGTGQPAIYPRRQNLGSMGERA